MNIDFMDVLDRVQNGLFCTEKEWDMRVFPGVIRKVLKKYALEKVYTSQKKKKAINCDDSLADTFWEAGVDAAAEVGMLCTTTERRITFTGEEILRWAKKPQKPLRLGLGDDVVDWVPRKPEDPRPAVTMLAGMGIPVDEDLFLAQILMRSQ